MQNSKDTHDWLKTFLRKTTLHNIFETFLKKRNSY